MSTHQFKKGMAVRIGRYKRILVKRLPASDGCADNKAWLIDKPVNQFRLWHEDGMKPWKGTQKRILNECA